MGRKEKAIRNAAWLAARDTCRALQEFPELEFDDLVQIAVMHLLEVERRGYTPRSPAAAHVWARQGINRFLRWRRARKRNPELPPVPQDQLTETDAVDTSWTARVDVEVSAQDLGGDTPAERLQRIFDAEGVGVDVDEFLNYTYRRVIRRRKLGDFRVIRVDEKVYLEREGRVYLWLG